VVGKKNKEHTIGSIKVSRTDSPRHTHTKYNGWDVQHGAHSVNADDIRLKLDYLFRMGLLRPEIKAVKVVFIGESEE
jgi:hypothetical protein